MKVVFTRKAEKNLNSIKQYITQEFGSRSTEEFVQKADEFFGLLKIYPLLGQPEKVDIRGFQLTPQTRILYRKTENKIVVLAFFDVRQNSKKKY